MYRFAQEQLVRWKSSPAQAAHRARGTTGRQDLARRALADAEFDALVKLDLEKRRDLHHCFGDNLDAHSVLRQLELATGGASWRTHAAVPRRGPGVPAGDHGAALLLRAVPELHVIAAGSLLEFVMGDIPVPVGRVQHLHLYPMTFREYPVGSGKRGRCRMGRPASVDGGRVPAAHVVERVEDLFLRGRHARERRRVSQDPVPGRGLSGTDRGHRHLS